MIMEGDLKGHTPNVLGAYRHFVTSISNLKLLIMDKNKPFLLILLLFLVSCGGMTKEIPATSTSLNEEAPIYPDYRDITIPCNIAPLNVMVESHGEAFAAAITSPSGKQIIAAADKNKLFFDETEWHDLLETEKGNDLKVTIYVKRAGVWNAFNPYALSVAPEPIDSFLSYRLIEPSFELYRQLGLYQRNLTNFEEYPIYENNNTFSAEDNHCINCHNYQNFDATNMLFHVRASHGGTIMVEDGEAKKLKMTVDSVLGNSVYPSWHPELPLIAFSSNQTGQVFHLTDLSKIEVVDYASDLVLYDVENNTLSNVLRTKDYLETFPHWSPDGKRLFFCRAHTPQLAAVPDSVRSDKVITLIDSLHYDVMSMEFDPETRIFGEPVLEVACATQQRSAAVPRVSPDGRYVLYTEGNRGQFHIWHPEADLFVKDLQSDSIRCLKNASASGPDSYHTWSSNGRWIVVASRRDDGSYSRAYIAYFDADGNDHKAFVLPQYDPEHNFCRMKSYNVPELTRNAVKTTPVQLREVVYDDESTQQVEYK